MPTPVSHIIIPDQGFTATLVGSVNLHKLHDKFTILYFYPKDSTSGCTVEAESFNHILPKIRSLGGSIIGVSKCSIASHKKFSDKLDLKFPLISDSSGELCEAFKVWVEKSMYGRKYMGIERSTFVLDARGQVLHEWRKVAVKNHATEVINYLTADIL